MAGRLRVERDVEVARWLQRSLADDTTVRVVVPPIFEAYARILHPASLEAAPQEAVAGATDAEGADRASREITWAEAASLIGDRIGEQQPWTAWLRRFGEVGRDLPDGSRLIEGHVLPDGRSIEAPHSGDIPSALLASLTGLLLDEGGDRDVLAAVWEGNGLDVDHPGVVFGWTDEPEPRGPIARWLQRRRQQREMQREHERAVRASIDPEVTAAMRAGDVLGLPREQQGRGHVLLRTRLATFADPAWEQEAGLGWRDDWHSHGRTPNALWPTHPQSAPAWFVATDLDLDITHVGGSASLIGRVLAHPSIEAEQVRPTDPLV